MASRKIAKDGRLGASSRAKIRERVWARSDKHCHWCRIALIKTAGRPETFVVDHVNSVHGGGSQTDIENCVAACYRCNSLKGDLSADTWAAVMSRFRIRNKVAAGLPVKVSRADVISWVQEQGGELGGKVEFVTARRWWSDEADASIRKAHATAGWNME
ncbi:HNH endonuclease [Mycolicibacter arupensis]|jgi:hypothetical protein|uniref:HNH endonuclease n=1 Tax=Mycolicibacter arupensis TaxID=342002 RepID=A0A5C7YEG4_9MYCO|nr:HNH endonuclease signature motif containing protein [Mycolicibacter arupensis]TXI59957.1 MAG: HNH endonuclease [Mycolicibacter arupensis]